MKKSLLTLVTLLLAVVANAAENLWASAQVTSSFYYAPNWNQIADPVLNVENGTYSYTLPQATYERWQAQAFLVTDIPVNSKKTYDFSMTITSNKNVNAAIKLYEKGKDTEFFFTEKRALVAGEATRVEHLSMKGMDFAALCLVVDVGGNYENTTITISDVCFSEGTASIGTDLTDEGADANGVHKLSGIWDMEQFKAIDAEAKANAYDFTDVSDLPDAIANQNVCTNPNTFFISPRAGHFLFNEVVKEGDNGYRGYNIQLIDHFANTNDHSVNTSIAPITVVSPLFQRVASRGNIYSTVVLPFVQANMPTTVKFYGLESVTTESDVTKIVFKEVETPEVGVPYMAHLDGADIYMAGSGEEKTITWTTSENKVAGASFVPTFTSVEAADGQYVVEEGEDLVAKKNESAAKAFTAYLLLPTVGNEIQVSIATATGVRQIDAAAIATLFNVYSVDGKLVKRNAKNLIGLKQGLYVVNGKKVMVK